MMDLIWSQVHLRSEGQGRLFAVSHELIKRLNPEADILVIDNASPLDPVPFTRSKWTECQLSPMSELVPDLEPGAHVGSRTPAMVHFHESLGHFFHGHSHGRAVRDGPGRAHSLALQMALQAGYSRACYIEADALFRWPVEWCFAQMTKPVGCQPRCAYGYLDWHVWPIKDMAWMRAFDFVGRYDWRNRVGEPGGEAVGEQVYADIFGDNLEVVPMSGIRGDTVALTAHNLREHFPEGSDYLTHVQLDCFALWLEMVGHGDLAPLLFETVQPRQQAAE